METRRIGECCNFTWETVAQDDFEENKDVQASQRGGGREAGAGHASQLRDLDFAHFPSSLLGPVLLQEMQLPLV